jgi:hypothetical protein
MQSICPVGVARGVKAPAVPTLIMHGNDDQIVPWRVSGKYRRAMTDQQRRRGVVLSQIILPPGIRKDVLAAGDSNERTAQLRAASQANRVWRPDGLKRYRGIRFSRTLSSRGSSRHNAAANHGLEIIGP